MTNAGAGGSKPWKENKKFRAQSTTKQIGRRMGQALTCYSARRASLSESPETSGGTKSFVVFAARARAVRPRRRASVSPCAWDA
jgi:hypothetical protein